MSIQITAELVKELRDATGVSVMQCKNALTEAEGDMEKALIILKQKSSTVAMKKADREAHDGTIVVKGTPTKVVILKLHSETDFVARNSDFTTLADTLASMALTEGIDTMKTKSIDMINEVTQKVGEKIELGAVEEITGDVLGSYVHAGKSAVVVSLTGGTEELAKDIAMHIAAMKPLYTTDADITADDKAKVIEVIEKEVSESDKPEEIKKKMLEGKINTYFKEQTLMDQSFIKNPDLTVGALLANANASLVRFVRESIG
ncbi:MAG: translation elongation factor Ts [Candidatus Pacebacteria bacterium]|jgi:elongation factor Ts|nr:translation elongation factor Ts [Candidatus Paceibacterota bacterium]